MSSLRTSSSHVAKLIIYFVQKWREWNRERKSFPFFHVASHIFMCFRKVVLAERVHLKLLEIFMVRRFSEWRRKRNKMHMCARREKVFPYKNLIEQNAILIHWTMFANVRPLTCGDKEVVVRVYCCSKMSIRSLNLCNLFIAMLRHVFTSNKFCKQLLFSCSYF